MISWHSDKVEFVEWLAFYNNVYALPKKKRPPQHVIDNDSHLDKWIRKLSDEKESGSTATDEQDVHHFNTGDDEIILE